MPDVIDAESESQWTLAPLVQMPLAARRLSLHLYVSLQKHPDEQTPPQGRCIVLYTCAPRSGTSCRAMMACQAPEGVHHAKRSNP